MPIKLVIPVRGTALSRELKAIAWFPRLRIGVNFRHATRKPEIYHSLGATELCGWRDPHCPCNWGIVPSFATAAHTRRLLDASGTSPARSTIERESRLFNSRCLLVISEFIFGGLLSGAAWSR